MSETDSDLNLTYNSSDFEREKDEELKRKMTRVMTFKEDTHHEPKKREMTQEEMDHIQA
jgi:hypothetical protein